jgi:hypothetical protein
MEIITYATESRGRFNSLTNNKFKVPVTVLGWGTTWNGFTDKFKGVLKHIETKKPDDIVLFLDGFDSEINRNPTEVATIFKSLNCGVLFSKNVTLLGTIENIPFGTCKNNIMANTGMYIGYVKNIKKILTDALYMNCKDDQVNINRLCHKYNDIKVDEDEILFKNIRIETDENFDAYFLSYPGGMSIHRYTRALIEYYQFYYFHISIILLLLMTIFPKTAIVLLFTHLLIFICKADKSCI